jgi:peptide/nickel transport system substrate-binding protein
MAKEMGLGGVADQFPKHVLSRRAVIQRAVALGVGLPAATMLASCGADDEDPTAISGSGEPKATPEAGGSPSTSPEDEPTPTSSTEQTAPVVDGEATPATGGTFVDGGDRLMGQEFEPGISGGTLIEAGYGGSVNFSRGGNTYALGQMVFESLLELNPFTLEPVGLLAEAWEVSEDGTTWTFSLREGVSWHDGEPFTGEDVVFSYEYLLTPELNAPAYSILTQYIASIDLIDDYTVAFAALAVRPDFWYYAARRWVAAEHVLADIPPADYPSSPAGTGEDPSLVVGTGPFKFVDLVEDEHFTLERNDDYWDGAPYLDGFVSRVYPSAEGQMTALLAGDADFVYEILLSYLPQLQEAGMTLAEWQAINPNAILFNLDPERTALFQDVRVRQALMYALDRQAMVDTSYEGVGEVVDIIMTRGSVYSNPDGITVRYSYDPDRANDLLDEAGWAMGPDGVRQKDGQRLSFTLLSSQEWEPWAIDAQVTQEYWRAVGVEVELEFVEIAALYELCPEGNYDAALFDFFPFAIAPDMSDFFACDSANNWTSYCNPEVDALLAEGSTTLDLEQRVEIYTEFQNRVLEDLPVIVLYYPNGYSAASPRVHNAGKVGNYLTMWYAAEKIWIEQ